MAPGRPEAGAAPASGRRFGRSAGPAGPAAPSGSVPAQLRRLLAPVAGRFAAAGVVGTLAALFAVALAGLSGWLIIRASEQPPILYLLTAIVGVRFFGVGRACLRYAERLLLHDAVFAALTRLRGRLWESLSRRALSLRRLLQGGNVLGTVVDDVDTVRELLPRVVLPPLTAIAVAAAAVAGIGLLLPAALPAVGAAALLSIVVAPALALAADRMSAGTEQRLRSGVLRHVAAALDARAELHANGVERPRARRDRPGGPGRDRSLTAVGVGGRARPGPDRPGLRRRRPGQRRAGRPARPERCGRTGDGRRRRPRAARPCGPLRGHHHGRAAVPGAARRAAADQRGRRPERGER